MIMLHPFALRATALSVLVTSAIALIPPLVTVGGSLVKPQVQPTQAAVPAAHEPVPATPARATRISLA
jgi:hypothetical protein